MSGDSKNSESPTIERVFEVLDKWRHLPAYQLERRADIFFALYLPEVLGKHFGMKVDPLLVPEFPIKKKGDNTSNKADYLALQESEGGEPAKQPFLVELKTDMASLTSSKAKNQKKLLEEAAEKDIEDLVCGVIDISKSKHADRRKYIHLLWRLQELGLVSGVNKDVYTRAFPEVKPGDVPKVKSGVVTKGLAKVKVTVAAKGCPKPKVVYIQPESDSSHKDIHYISFEDFAGIIERGENKDDAIRRSFACCLRKWKQEKAGSLDPRTLHS